MWFVIEDWMIDGIGLRGNELLAYALIYSYSRENSGTFYGSTQFLAERIGCNKKTAITTLKSLMEKGLVERSAGVHDGLQTYDYIAKRGECKNYTSVNSTSEWCKNYTDSGVNSIPPSGVKITPNNTSNINKTDRDRDNKKDDFRFPYSSVRFMELWSGLITQPKWKGKSHLALQMSLDKLGKVDELTACRMMEETIANDWRGLFEPQPKREAQTQQRQTVSPFEAARRGMEEINRRLDAGFYDTPDEQ